MVEACHQSDPRAVRLSGRAAARALQDLQFLDFLDR